VATVTVPDEPELTAFGVVALTFMTVMYAMEDRGPGFIAAFALGVHSPASAASSQERGQVEDGRVRSITLLFDWQRWPEVLQELERRTAQPDAADA